MRTRIFKITTTIVLTPIALVVMAAIALYIPPIQQWAVNKACEYASEKTGMNVGIESVHLAFPLDLSLAGVHCMEKNDSLPQVTDTIASIGKVIADVELLPLIDGNVNVNAIEINQAHINTADLVHTCRIKGYVGRLMIDNNEDVDTKHVASVALKNSMAQVHSVILDNAHVNIELSDTVPADTTKSENEWRIYVQKLSITNSSMQLHLPGDTIQIGATLKDVQAKGGYLDLMKGLYDVNHLGIAKSSFTLDNHYKTHATTGFDANHMAFKDINLSADSIRYWGADTLSGRKSYISCLIKQASLKEQSGINLKSLKATVKIDSTAMMINGALSTPSSSMIVNLKMQPNVIDSLDIDRGRIDARIDASLGRQDLIAFAFGSMPASFKSAWPLHPLSIKGEMHGNLSEVAIPLLSVTLPTAFSLDARGNARGFMALAKNIYSQKFNAKLHGDLKTYNMSFVKTLLDRNTQKMIDIPSVHAIADLTANGSVYNVSLKATEGRGNITANAYTNIASMNYNADVKAHGFNVGHFIKGYGLGTFSGSLTATGKGLEILENRTSMNVKANIQQFRYGQYDLNNMRADLALKNGKVDGVINADNTLMKGMFALNGTVSTRLIDVAMTAQLEKADLYRLNVVGSPLTLAMNGKMNVSTDMKEYYKVTGKVSDIEIADTAKTHHPDDVLVDVLTSRDTTHVNVDCGDFAMKMDAQGGYKQLLSCTDKMKKVLERHFAERTINQDDIRKILPHLTLSIYSEKNNTVYRIAKYLGYEYSLFDLKMKTSKEDGIFADMKVNGLSTSGYKLDTITVNVKSQNNPKEIFYEAHIQNRPPNDYVFEVFFDGKVLPHGISVNTKVYDNKNDLAVKVGVEANMEERGINLHLTPKNPVLGYTNFSLNDDNFILLAHNNRVHANVNLLGTHNEGIKIYCTDERYSYAEGADNIVEPTSTTTAQNDSTYVDDYLQDITLSLNNINLERLTSSLPYLPKIEGDMNGDFHAVQNADGSFTLSNEMMAKNLIYEGCAIGNLGCQFTYFPKDDGSHHVDGIVTLNDNEIASVIGSYNMNTSAVDGTLKLEKFPMAIANGFIPDQLIGLDGYAEGDLSVQGTTSVPIVNGELYLEDAALLSVPYGVRLRFDDDPVRITNSKLLLENFNMYAPNDQPLLIYGNVDFSDLDHINVDMKMKANNFQLINAKENLRSTTYGNVYVNALALMKGELDKLNITGRLEVLPTTDLYYILRDSPITTDNTMKELVTFTSLSAGNAPIVVKPQVNGLNMKLNVVVDEGAHVKAWLDASHNNYVGITGSGDLRMTYRNETLAMTGRYSITEGDMKYSLQVIPLKTFAIQDGSYIEWTGDIMNPHLNITALETINSTVYRDNTNQRVTFQAGVKISKTVNDMGLEFLIYAPEDKLITEQLNARSAEERGKLAVTLLSTGMYISDGNTSNFTMNSALNSFLQSEINNIAGNALKTVDLSFGMESSTLMDGTIHNDYTFKFAKRFWNNRLSISVGGKISSGPEVSGQNKSFFDNVEMQYRLTATSNKYLQAFYKRNVYDYLEGYLSQFGGGFLWKKKSQTFLDIFHNEKKDAFRINTKSEKKDSTKSEKDTKLKSEKKK